MSYCNLRGGQQQSTALSGQLGQGPRLQANISVSYSADVGNDYIIGDGLKLENGVLSVDTVNQVLEDNTKPVTSGAVYMELGNVEALLANI